MPPPGDRRGREIELLFPRTDAGVVVQVVALLTLFGTGLWAGRGRPEVRLLVIGLGLVTLALVGLRAAH